MTFRFLFPSLKEARLSNTAENIKAPCWRYLRLGLTLAAMLVPAAPALAGLGASVTLASGQPGTIYPGGTTQLQITLSNSSANAVTGTGFSNSLPGTLPNGLKVAGTATYNCTNPATSTTAPGVGTLTAVSGTQAIVLASGVIPAQANNVNGTCIIVIPVTAGSSTGNSATYTYTIDNGAVTGNDGGAVSNSGAVSQGIVVRSVSLPTVSKSFSNSMAYLGGATVTLTIVVSNPNSIALPNFSVTDTFPQLPNPAVTGSPQQGIIKVAENPAATSTCTGSGIAATFVSLAAGATSITASGGTVEANGSCTLTVAVEANHTNGQFLLSSYQNNIISGASVINDLGLVLADSNSASIGTRSPLNVTKIFGHASLASGQADTLTITMYNDGGSSPLTVSAFTDDPIDGVGNAGYGLKVSGSPTVSCSGTGNVAGTYTATVSNTGIIQTANTTIVPGGSCSISVPFIGTAQTSGTPISFTNTIAEGAVTTTTTGVVSRLASSSIIVADNLRVTKSATPSQAAPGNPVRYSVTVENYSASAASNVAITDTLANGLTFLTGTIGVNNYTPTVTSGCGTLVVTGGTGVTAPVLTITTLPARTGVNTPGSCTVTFYAMAATNATNSSPTSNTLAAGSVCYGSGPPTCNGGASNTTTGTVTTSVLAVAKAYNLSSPQLEGTITRATITITNLSANPLTAVSVADTLPLAASGGQMRVANPSNATSTCGSPTITAVAGSTSIAMNGGTVPARADSGASATGSSCLLLVDVVAPAGIYTTAAGHANTATVAGTETYANGTTHAVSASASADFTFSSPLSATKTFSPAAVSSGGKSTVTVRLSNSGAGALSGVAVTDPLPAGMVLATPPNAYTTCAGSTAVSATAGAGNGTGTGPRLSGAVIAGGGNCDFVFDVTATGSASWVNTIPAGNITASGGISNQSAVIGTLAYAAPNNPSIAKATNPSTLTFPGQTSVLTITVNGGTQAVTSLGFTDYFTVTGTSGATANGMAVAPTPGAATTCPNGIVTATPGATSVSLSGATLAANASCTVTVNVTSTSVGGITNYIPSGSIHTDQGLTNTGQATTSLTTQSNIGVVKQFTPNIVKPGQRSRLRITFYNPTAQPASSLAVIDTLPTGVTVPSGPNATTTCTGATVSSPTASQVQVAGGAIAAASGGVAASCYAEIDVVVAAQGDYLNTIAAGTVTAIVGGSPVSNSEPTSDTLRAKSPLVVHKAIASKTLDTGNPVGFTTGSASAAPGASATLTVRLDNPNAVALTAAAFTDTLPTGLVVAQTPGAATTCSGGTVIAAASATSIRLSGATIPANGSCTVTVSVLSNISGTYTNTIAAGGVTTLEGVSNEDPTSAQIVISTPPTVSKQFAPAVIAPSGTSTLTIVLGNSNSGAVTLTSAFVDTLPTAPGAIVVATSPNKASTCGGGVGAVTAVTNAGTITLANGSTIPAGGCTISVDVTGVTPGVHTNNIPAGTLITDFGNNQQPANSTLTISTLGYISGRVFKDNNVTPNGTYESGTDTPLESVSIELRNGGVCSGALVSISGLVNPASTDVLGNYLFSGLPAGTYSVCEPVQPTGTTNGIATAGAITPVSGSTGTAGTASNSTATTSQIVGIILNANGGGGEVSGSTGNNFAEVPGNAPDLAIAKTHSPASFPESSTSGYYTITPSNVGTVATSGVITIVDTLPTGITVAATATGTGWSCAGAVGAGVVTCTSTTVIAANGGTGNPITLRVAVAAGQVGQVLTNTAVISGGGEPPGFDGNNTATDSVAIASAAAVSGHVWLDRSHNRTFADSQSVPQAGWIVELLLSGVQVASTTTGTDGAYSFTGLAPGTGYQIRFRHPTTGGIFGSAVPNETATSYVSGVTSANNLAGAITTDGTLSNLTLLAGVTTVEQSLPLDPAGVVYDAVTRQPVPGAAVTIAGPGSFNPAIHLVGGSATVTTGADGLYQFLLNPAAPNGVYTLTVTTYPAGYLPAPSSMIPVCTGTLAVGASPNPALIQSSNLAPAVGVAAHTPSACPGIVAGGSASTQYFSSFNITLGTSANVVNNHIPLDPVLGGAIVMTKTTPLVNVARGDLVPYTVTATNTLAATLSSINVVDRIPPGFRYRLGSATLNGASVAPVVAGRDLTWANQTFTAGERKTWKMILVVGTGVGEGEYVNQTWSLNSIVSTLVSNIASATVRVIPDPTFDCSDIVGKVFDDKNANGYQDQGEPGIPNVRVVTARGLLVTTDAEGRFHVACAAIPQADHGSNFVMKLDERTLPSGYRLTTENPRDVRVTRGKMVKLNFGAAVHRVVRLELTAAAFAGEAGLAPEWAARLDAVVAQLKSRPSVLRISYAGGGEDARARLDAVAARVKELWKAAEKEKETGHPLLIETELEGAK